MTLKIVSECSSLNVKQSKPIINFYYLCIIVPTIMVICRFFAVTKILYFCMITIKEDCLICMYCMKSSDAKFINIEEIIKFEQRNANNWIPCKFKQMLENERDGCLLGVIVSNTPNFRVLAWTNIWSRRTSSFWKPWFQIRFDNLDHIKMKWNRKLAIIYFV